MQSALSSHQGAHLLAARRRNAVQPCYRPRPCQHRSPVPRVCATSSPSTATAEAAVTSAALKSPFFGIQDEATLFGTLEAAVGGGKVPPELVPAFKQLYGNYKKAVLGSGKPGNDETLVATVMASIVDRVLVEFLAPYKFPSHHLRILQPYNYYDFGQRYVRALIDFDRSVVGYVERFSEIQRQLEAGHNVVLLANHQTEADPGVWALLLEATLPSLATDVTYVAGDRVVTDNLCKPFSMGRNLFCVHSKKHMDDFPELKAEKQAMNRRTLKAMSTKLNEGGQLLWIAPSGGRDRKNQDTGELLPDSFDGTAVELMRQLLDRAGPEGHLYPFAMHSYEVMPPPATKEKAVGEERITNHAPCAIAVGPELQLGSVAKDESAGDKETRVARMGDLAHAAVTELYKEMVGAMHSGEHGSGYSQPWRA